MREIKAGQKYKHFKGTMIEVIDIAKHSETLEELETDKHLVDGEIWARPIDMFNSLVDKEKYPDVEQEYRFEEARW